jgi:hypothetical protein
MKTFYLLLCLLTATVSHSQTIENELNKLIGTFAGEWSTYAMDQNGERIKTNSWKDTLRGVKPVINDTLAYVTIKAIMHFDNPNIPAYPMKFIEGFKLEKGKIKSHFFNIMGNETIDTKINEDTYVISQDISPYELKQFGFETAKKAVNTTIKVVLDINGTEIHKIKRISTISWIENSEEKYVQFVSMDGYHKKISN